MNSDNQKGKQSASLFSLNESASEAFSQIAQYLELQGENPFKIKAYVKASRVLRDLEEDLNAISKRGELKSIPGVGAAIADKLEAFLATGSIPQLEALKKEIPAGLVEVASLPGLGAKKTVALHKELGISSLRDLQAACLEERLETVKGFSKKSQSKYLELVEKALASSVIFVKSRLEEWGVQTCDRLAEVAGVRSVLVVGAVRRRAPFSDRLEILLLCDNLEAARQEVLGRTSGDEVATLPQGDDLILSHPSGCPIHLLFRPATNPGWEILSCTGPEPFVAGLKPMTAASEEEIFQQQGLAFVAPELREHEAPWSVGPLLEESQVKGNLHTHTTWSDGKHSLAEMVAEAGRRGHEYFGVSDHSRALVIANGLTIERLQEQGAEIRALDSTLPNIRVFRSVECDILEDGTLDYPSQVLDGLDYVVAAVHSFFHLDSESMTKRLLEGTRHPRVRVLAHPTGRRLDRRDGYTADWEQVVAACAERRVAVEINANPWRLDLSEELLRLAMEKGCLISINTDAHSLAEFDNLRHGVDMARRVGLDPDRVVNTWPLVRLRSWFEERVSRVAH
ncbi:MAG: PHP domain-containing protein [Vulcanimicrobiota bacterium]